MDIQLIIKAPNQNVDDHVVHCNLDWTVENLKSHLSEAYPNKPEVVDQKLIYSGRLLRDHLHLRDILRHENGKASLHILHLVCSDKSPTENKTSSSHVRKRQPTVRPQVQANRVQFPDNPVGQQNMFPSQNNFLNSLQPGGVPQPVVPVFVPDAQVAAQVAAMQQMYTYYFSQYFQSVNTGQSNQTTPQFPNLQPYQQRVTLNEDLRQIQENQRLQGGRGVAEENDELINRDWLDHLFLCARFLIFFFVVYFYSTPERLMIVTVCAIVAFLYQEGWFVRRVNPPAVGEVNAAPQQNVNNVENNENEPLVNQDHSANEEDSGGEHEIEATMDGDDPPHAQSTVAVNDNHIFSPFTFLSTFFSSLIPEPPPPVNIN